MDRPFDRPQTDHHPQVIGRIGPRLGAGVPASAARVLIVSDRPGWSDGVRGALGALGVVCDLCRTMSEACAALAIQTPDLGIPSPAPKRRASEMLRRPEYDAIVSEIALPDGDGLALAGAVETLGTPVILVAKRASIDLASCAIQHGAADLVERAAITDSDLAARILAIALRFRSRRDARSHEPRRLFRLRHTGMDDFRLLAPQTGPGDSDLLHVTPERADTMKNVTNVSEFKGLIRGELDIEQLLRTTLEFVLARSGPTNAAVFLPTTSGDYSLGAYVNYDCPKETCDVLLDHLANAVAPRFENVKGMAHLTDEAGLSEYLDNDADWLKDSHVVGFPCTHGEECLAVFMLFRDQNTPYALPLLEQVKTVGELFAAQLARVIHIHHRHLPKNKWGMIGDPPAETDDYGDMAA